MAKSENALLNVSLRQSGGSRVARRLRKTGLVPGIVYGLDQEPIQIQLEARELRLALAHSGAVIDLTIDNGEVIPAMLKDLHRHPVRGDYIHVDLLRVNLNKRVNAVVPIELTDVEDSVGVKQGGVLERFLREINIEALPNAIPEVIEHSIASLDIGVSVTLADVKLEDGLALLDDTKTLVATITPPRVGGDDAEAEEAPVSTGSEAEETSEAEGDESSAE